MQTFVANAKVQRPSHQKLGFHQHMEHMMFQSQNSSHQNGNNARNTTPLRTDSSLTNVFYLCNVIISDRVA